MNDLTNIDPMRLLGGVIVASMVVVVVMNFVLNYQCNRDWRRLQSMARAISGGRLSEFRQDMHRVNRELAAAVYAGEGDRVRKLQNQKAALHLRALRG